MCNTELGRFCSTHDNWEELLTNEPYYLKIREDGPYVIFNYDQIRSDFNNFIVREARGIIFRNGEWDVPVCFPFVKFFNYGEQNADEIDWEHAFVSEKIDGSLIKLWFDHGSGWHISTNSTIDAYKALMGDAKFKSFGDYFADTLSKYYDNSAEFYGSLNIDCTYMFELVGPYNKVVIPYDEPEIYFLGARNKFTGEEFNCSPLLAGALSMGRFKLPKQYKLDSLEACILCAETFKWDKEGLVVSDTNGNRVKVKSPEYILAHYARNNNIITRKRIINVILANEIEEFICYVPEYKEELYKIKNLMNSFYKVGDSIACSARKLRTLDKSTFAAWAETLPKLFKGVAFRNYYVDVSAKEYTSGWSVYKWEDYLESFEKLINDYFMFGEYDK